MTQPQPLDDIINEVLRELLKMCSDDTRAIDDENRSPFLQTNRQRVKELGEKLNEYHGISGMVYVAVRIPPEDLRELEYAWDGIGDWQC